MRVGIVAEVARLPDVKEFLEKYQFRFKPKKGPPARVAPL
jgi:hypothetical protein